MVIDIFNCFHLRCCTVRVVYCATLL